MAPPRRRRAPRPAGAAAVARPRADRPTVERHRRDRLTAERRPRRRRRTHGEWLGAPRRPAAALPDAWAAARRSPPPSGGGAAGRMGGGVSPGTAAPGAGRPPPPRAVPVERPEAGQAEVELAARQGRGRTTSRQRSALSPALSRRRERVTAEKKGCLATRGPSGPLSRPRERASLARRIARQRMYCDRSSSLSTPSSRSRT